RRESRGRIAEPPKRAFPIRQPFVHVLGLGTRGRLVKGFCDPFVLSRRPLHRAGARTERREVGDSLLGCEGGERSDRTSAVRGSIVWLAADAGSCASPPRDRSKYLDRRRDR